MQKDNESQSKKVYLTSFLKIKGRVIRTQVLKHLPRAREGERERSKEDIKGVATAREATGKSRYVRVIERKEVRRDDPIEYFLPTGVGTTF